MRNFSNYIKFVLPIFVIFIVGCEKDDDHDDHAHDHDHNVVAPETYEFTRNGSSTVSFSGQTTRYLNLMNFTENLIAQLQLLKV